MKEPMIEIVNKFNIAGTIENIIPYGNGLINKTFLVKTSKEDYLLQQINHYVFKDVDGLMNNIYLVTKHLDAKNVTTLSLVLTKEGKIYLNHNGTYFRMFLFIDNSVCYESLDNLEMVYHDGEAFGLFHNLLADFDSTKLSETIPNFHNTPVRFKNLSEAAKKDKYTRLKMCEEEFNFIKESENEISKIMDYLNSSKIPLRIVHNDPKINNVLFDKDNGKIKCVVDLDTIMPGSCLFDYGDALRSLFTGDNQSSKDSSLLKVNINIFKAYTEGYMSKAKDFLNKEEISLMPISIYILAMELAIRFLEDFLNGDTYFKTTFENENLYRAKNQIALAKDIIKNMSLMDQIVSELVKD